MSYLTNQLLLISLNFSTQQLQSAFFKHFNTIDLLSLKLLSLEDVYSKNSLKKCSSYVVSGLVKDSLFKSLVDFKKVSCNFSKLLSLPTKSF